jgi:large subunit ribosomal protein L5
MYSKQEFLKNIAPELQKSLEKGSISAVPKLEKVTINVGCGSLAANNKGVVKEIVENLEKIAGQKPQINNARISVSNFKIREGMPVGVSVTLRGQAMYNFFGKLVDIVFPRIRDFKGFTAKSFDGQGNYTLGIKEHTVFPEINPDDLVTIHGLQIVVKTSADNDKDGEALLRAFHFPFKEKETVNN